MTFCDLVSRMTLSHKYRNTSWNIHFSKNHWQQKRIWISNILETIIEDEKKEKHKTKNKQTKSNARKLLEFCHKRWRKFHWQQRYRNRFRINTDRNATDFVPVGWHVAATNSMKSQKGFPAKKGKKWRKDSLQKVSCTFREIPRPKKECFENRSIVSQPKFYF